MKSSITNYRQSPRKARLVADAVSGKSVTDAITILSFMPKRGALPIKKLILSAVANAVSNGGFKKEDLTVKRIFVDKGVTIKRIMPKARGTADRINKRTSNIVVILEDSNLSKSKKSKKTSAKIVADMENSETLVPKPKTEKVKKSVANKKDNK